MRKVWGKSLTLILGTLCVLLLLIVGIYATGQRTMNFGVNINMNANMLVKVEMGTVPSSDAVNCNYVTIFNNSQISGSGTVSSLATLSVDTVSLSSTLISNWLGEGQSLTSGTKLYFRVTNYTDSEYAASSGITTPAIYAKATATTIISGIFTEERVYSSTTDPVYGAQNITAYNGVLANAVSKEMSLQIETAESGTVRIDLNLSVQEQGDKEVAMQISGVSSSNTDEYVKTGTTYTTTLTADEGLVLPGDLNVLVGSTQLNNTGDGTGYTYSNATGALTIPSTLVTDHLIITGEAKQESVPVGFEFRNNDVYATYGGQTYSNAQGFSAISSSNITITLTSTTGKFVCPEVLVWKDGVGEKQWVSLNGLDYAFNQTTAGSGTLTINKKEITDKVLVRATSVDIWDGTPATGYNGGDGSETNPYQIATAKQLAYLANQVDAGTTYGGKYFELTNNILLNNLTNYTTFTTTNKFTTETRWANDATVQTSLNQWNPIGNSSYTFQGNIDGNNFAVSGMYINSTDSYQGLFDRIYYSETKNLGVVSGYAKASASVGGLARLSLYCKIENCYSTVNTYATTSGRASGLIGWIVSSYVSNCYVNSHINSTGAYGGLFCAISYQKSVMRNCFSYGVAVGNNILGGIAGKNGGSGGYGYLSSCINYGNISGSIAGGIAGDNSDTLITPNSSITNSINYGVVYGSLYSGGIVYYQNVAGSFISNCTNLGKVVGNDASQTGSLIARTVANTIIENCYYLGEFNRAVGTNNGVATNLSSIDPTSLKLNSNVYVGDTLVDNVQSVGTGTLYASGSDLIDVLNAWSNTYSQMKWVNMASGKLSPSGNVADYFAGGTGNSQTPYLISTAQQLANINYLVKGNNFALTGNIDLNPGITFTFKADSGLVEITNGTATVFMGTGIKGDTSGASGTFDTTASTQGAYYIYATATTPATATTSTYRFLSDIRKTTIKNGATTLLVLNEWSPIGNDDRDIQSRFSGNFNGANHEVSGLFINTTTSFNGLFGYNMSATVKNVGVVNNCIKGNNYDAGIVGYNYSGTVDNCYNSGTIVGGTYIGGVVGINHTNSKVIDCYNTGAVSGTGERVGGVVGQNISYSIVDECQNSGIVFGANNNTGGIVGRNESFSLVNNCFNVGTIKGIGTQVGGVVGQNITSCFVSNSFNAGKIEGGTNYVGGVVADTRTSCNVFNCFNIGTVTGASSVGSLVGNNVSCTISWSYYITGTTPIGSQGGTISNLSDFDTADQILNSAVTIGSATYSANSTSMLDALNLYISTNPSITFNGQVYLLNQWTRDSSDDANNGASAINGGYPYFATGEIVTPIEPDETLSGAGTLASPFIISTASELAYLASEVNSGVTYDDIYFEQSADIFLTSTWSPIGTNGNAFKGIYNGNDYSISGLLINSLNSENQGLFGYVNGATIYNLAIKSANIKGKVNVGALVGYATGNTKIFNCSSSGFISGGTYVGGLVGKLTTSTLQNSYSLANISGTGQSIGGLIGYATGAGGTALIENVYFNGTVAESGYNVGAIIGEINTTSGSVVAKTNLFYNGSLSGVLVAFGTSSSAQVAFTMETAGTGNSTAFEYALNEWAQEISTNGEMCVWNTTGSYPVLSSYSQGDVFGVSRATTSTSTLWTRTDDNVGLVATANQLASAPTTFTPAEDDFEMGGDIPFYNLITIVNKRVDNGAVVARLGDSNFSWTGTTLVGGVSVATDVMTYYPTHYLKRTQASGVEYVQISCQSFTGATKIDGYYRGTFKANKDSTTVSGITVLRSYAGEKPATRQGGASTPVDTLTKISDFRGFASANTNNVMSIGDWRDFDFQYLYLVKYADYNSQTAVGKGVVDYAWTADGTNLQVQDKDNARNVLSGRDGFVGTNGSTSVWCLGQCDPWGNAWEFVDGITINDYVAVVAYDPSNYINSATSGNTGYTTVGYTNSNADGYVLTLGYDNTNSLIAFATTSSTSSTGSIQDYYYQATGSHVVIRGGTFNSGSYAGEFGLYCSTFFSFSSCSVGSRLLSSA